jgi:hypothetical protein
MTYPSDEIPAGQSHTRRAWALEATPIALSRLSTFARLRTTPLRRGTAPVLLAVSLGFMYTS